MEIRKFIGKVVRVGPRLVALKASMFGRRVYCLMKSVVYRLDIFSSTPMLDCENLVIRKLHGHGQSRDKICYFAHFDRDGRVDDYVLRYLKDLSQHFEVILVSGSSSMRDSEVQKFLPFVKVAILKENVGLDFGSWFIGHKHFPIEDRHTHCLFANDSVYGPLQNFWDRLFARSESSDIVGITDSREIEYHLQSYFLLFNLNGRGRDFLAKHFSSFLPLRSKFLIINEYEIGVSRRALRFGLKLSALCNYDEVLDWDRFRRKFPAFPAEKSSVNPTHYLWDELVKDYQMPFVKVELLRSNPQQLDSVRNWPSVVASNSQYPCTLIDGHLKRMHRRA